MNSTFENFETRRCMRCRMRDAYIIVRWTALSERSFFYAHKSQNSGVTGFIVPSVQKKNTCLL